MSMLLAYASRTGNVKRFVGKVGLPSIAIAEGIIISEPYILITYTDKQGQVPELVKEFLRGSSSNMQGVAASGNRNWKTNFALSADKVSRQYAVPLVHKFELSGMKSDVEYFRKRVEEITNESR